MKTHYIPENRFPMEIGPHVKLLGNYFFNLFLVTGQRRSALFEAGISGVVDGVIAQLDAVGISPDYLVLSHPHSDHVTGLPGLMDRFPRAQVVMAAGAAEFISHPKAGPLLIKEDGFMSKGLEQMGIAPGIQAARNITLSIIQQIKQTPLSDEQLTQNLFDQSYRDEFTLYTRENILNCTRLLVKRAREL